MTLLSFPSTYIFSGVRVIVPLRQVKPCIPKRIENPQIPRVLHTRNVTEKKRRESFQFRMPFCYVDYPDIPRSIQKKTKRCSFTTNIPAFSPRYADEKIKSILVFFLNIYYSFNIRFSFVPQPSQRRLTELLKQLIYNFSLKR